MSDEAGPDPDDSPKDACGVVAVYGPGQAVAKQVYLGLHALQHRGQEAAGMAISGGEEITVVKEMGLVANAFDDRTLAALQGHLGIGHTRYSTTGSSTWRNAQPVYRSVGEHEFGLGHNGNLTNTEKLAAGAGMLPGTVTSDSDLVAELLAAELRTDVDSHSDGRALERALLAVLPMLEGAYSFVLMDEGHVIGVRDPNGFRPLCLGRMDNGWVLASETPALDLIGASFVRELDPGEMVIIDATGARSVHPYNKDRINPKLCLFEFVYFARPDSQLYNRNVHAARVRMGEALAEQSPVDADLVMGVPESGLPAAEGYARQSGIPYGQGLVKNRYIGRSFIAPSQEKRKQAVRMKLNPLRENLAGKRVVVIDDSIVRGTTQQTLTKMLREAGATEVHLRISSPPIRWSCHYGIDTGQPGELLARDLTVEGVREYLSVDTLSYLDLDRLVESIAAPGAGFCDACFSGHYPTDVGEGYDKNALEVTDVKPEPAGEVLSLLASTDDGLLPADDAGRATGADERDQ